MNLNLKSSWATSGAADEGGELGQDLLPSQGAPLGLGLLPELHQSPRQMWNARWGEFTASKAELETDRIGAE